MGDTDRVIGAEVAKDGAPGSEAASGAAEDTEMDIGRQKEEALREALLKKRDCSERGEVEATNGVKSSEQSNGEGRDRKDSLKDRKRDRERSRDRDRHGSRRHDRDRRDRDRGGERERSRGRDRKRDRRSRSRSRDRRKDDRRRRSGSRERSRERRRSRSRERREKKNKRDRSRDRSRGREGLDDKPADDNSIAAQAAAAVKALMKNKNKEMGGVCLDPAALKLAKKLIIVDLPLGTGASMLKSIIGDAMVQRKLAKSCDCVAALQIQVDDATGVRRAEIEFTDPRCASECVDKQVSAQKRFTTTHAQLNAEIEMLGSFLHFERPPGYKPNDDGPAGGAGAGQGPTAAATVGIPSAGAGIGGLGGPAINATTGGFVASPFGMGSVPGGGAGAFGLLGAAGAGMGGFGVGPYPMGLMGLPVAVGPSAALQQAQAAGAAGLGNLHLQQQAQLAASNPSGAAVVSAPAASGPGPGTSPAKGAVAPPLQPKVSREEALRLSLKARRVWVRNLPGEANLDEVKASLVEFMALKHLSVFAQGEAIRDVCRHTGGGAIVELRTVREAQRLRKGLWGVTLQGVALQVGWPEDYVALSDDEVKTLMATSVLGIDGDGTVPVPSDEATARNCCAVLAAEASSAPLDVEATRILCLANLASEEELNDEEDATDIMEDTKEKCQKDFGGVDAALLITPGSGGDLGPKFLGKTMIRFADRMVAHKAALALHGLKFDGRPVAASFVEEEVFATLYAAILSEGKGGGQG